MPYHGDVTPGTPLSTDRRQPAYVQPTGRRLELQALDPLIARDTGHAHNILVGGELKHLLHTATTAVAVRSGAVAELELDGVDDVTAPDADLRDAL